jgi:hypothetical protein
MAWEDRNGKRYYYRKRRVGKRVISEYMGGGLAGELSALYDLEDKFKTDVQRAELTKVKEDAVKLDGKIREVERITKAMTRAVLLLSGYHAPRRQWRRIRK